MKLIQITDTHVGRPGQRIHGVDPRAQLEACVADINAHHADAALCLVTGDLVNEGAADEYENLAPVLRALNVPFRVMVGNHDARENLRRAFPDTPFAAGGFIQSVFEVPGGRLLLLDTLRVGQPSGELCDRRLAWLSAELSACTDQVYIAMHHPPVPIGMKLLDGMALSNAEDFWQILAPHCARVRMIVFGHAHRPVSGVYNGVAFAGCPATAHQVSLELGQPSGARLTYNHEPPCYAVLEIGERGCVIHQQRYSENWKLVA